MQQALIDDTMRVMLEDVSVKAFLDIGHQHDDFILEDNFKCASDEMFNATPCR